MSATTRVIRLTAVVLMAGLLAGCAASMAYRRGGDAAVRGDWDAAVVYYRRAVQEDPDKPEYRVALERAMQAASRAHLDAARKAEERGDLDAALREYRLAVEYDPTNRQAALRAALIDQTIRERIEAARPKSPVEEMRERARRTSPEPILNPASREPLNLRFTQASLRDILNFIGAASGINVTYTQDFRDSSFTIQLEGVTLEDALRQIMSANNLFYKVVNDRTILVIPESAQNRTRYEEQVIRTFYLSHADPQEMVQLLNVIMRIPGLPIIPSFVANKTNNSVTVRSTAPLMTIMERIVQANDRPKAEIVVDVQILEVNRNRAKQFGLDLNTYSITGLFSPEVAPTTSTGTGGGSTTSVPPFNLNTISQGISTADFWLSVPTAVIRFLESDTQTRLVAKPQLRGQEGEEITLNLGDQIPVPQTTFGSLGGVGGVATTPISSFNYKDVGVNVIMTPRVTFDLDIVLDLTVESSSLGRDINIAGQNLPSFGTRKVTTKIRLRDGESTLLAGLLREDERRAITGLPGLMRLPGFRQLFSNNDTASGQTDIVILITPRIVRSHELTQRDIDPLYIGSQQSFGLGGPPPLIAAPDVETVPAPEPAPQPAQPEVMPGTLPRPGIIPIPKPEPVPVPVPVPTPPAETPAPPPVQPPPAPPATTPAAPPQTPAPAPAPAAPPAQTPPAAGQTAAGGRIVVTTPGTDFRVGGGPYTVPLSMSNANGISTLSLTLTFNPAILRVRSVQEGSFMRQGGVTATFTHQVDATAGRVDITLIRGSDVVGASGTGLLAAVLFEAVGPGQTSLGVSAAGSAPAGTPLTIETAPATVTVK